MALFDNSGLAGMAGAAQNGGFVNPQDNLSNRLAALAKAFQGQGMQQQPQVPQQQQFMPPQTLAGAMVAHPQMQQQPVDFSRGPTPGNNSGY